MQKFCLYYYIDKTFAARLMAAYRPTCQKGKMAIVAICKVFVYMLAELLSEWNVNSTDQSSNKQTICYMYMYIYTDAYDNKGV